MDLLPGGDLSFRLNKLGKISQSEASFHTAEIILALEHLHSLGLVYRDLKPENVLLDERGHCCLSDFGLVARETDKILGTAGTPGYIAPEVFKRNSKGEYDPVNGNRIRYNRAVDAWSLGCVIYEMIVGKCPFRTKQAKGYYQAKFDQAEGDESTSYHYASCSMEINFDSPKFKSPEIAVWSQNLCMSLLERDPSRRLGRDPESMRELKSHPWFRHIDWWKLANKLIPPPFTPSSNDINAVPLGKHSKTELKSKETEKDLTPEEQRSWEGWEYTSPLGFQSEMIQFLEWSENEAARKKKRASRSSVRTLICRIS